VELAKIKLPEEEDESVEAPDMLVICVLVIVFEELVVTGVSVLADAGVGVAELVDCQAALEVVSSAMCDDMLEVVEVDADDDKLLPEG